ncbi:hypothetical protein BG011_009177 [Mortierella polycephala]|uniref:Uncharacterized protein n=1 Tax=Mortierella polycephala TaxID=41804 RepID=A0A9P6QCX8_9FUNG|nr:hypothetical protein BG011_009177 [Mortierella polycephala]
MSKPQSYKADLERPASLETATLNSNDCTDERLRVQGEKNPYYVHGLTWTEAEEKKIVRIFDFKVLSRIGIMCKSTLNRGNMANALTDNFMEDLNITLNTVTLGSTIFTIYFCLFEIPSNMAIRRAGPQRWILFLMCLWGLSTACQFASLETVVILSFFILPEGPTMIKGGFRFNGYLIDRQEQTAITRLIRDDPTMADSVKGVVSKKHLFGALTSYRVWPNILIGFFALAVLPPEDTNKFSLYFALIFAMGGQTCWHPVNATEN